MRSLNGERRGRPDRRRHARGGRRAGDPHGYSPLIMVVDADPDRRDLSEAILAKLQFAVVPVESVDQAVTIAHALRPSVIVCRIDEAVGLRARLRVDVPIVEVAPGSAISDALVDIVRAALRVASAE